jgi:tRNA(fMet)-specific endonuclease VapC
MNWLLDTNACIRYLNGRAPKLKQRIDAASPGDVLVCSVVKSEMYYGAAKSIDPARTLANQKRFLSLFPSLPFDDAAAEVCGIMRSQLESSGQPIGPNDLLIASIALNHGITLVTHNTSEFGRVKGLLVEDWEL